MLMRVKISLYNSDRLTPMPTRVTREIYPRKGEQESRDSHLSLDPVEAYTRPTTQTRLDPKRGQSASRLSSRNCSGRNGPFSSSSESAVPDASSQAMPSQASFQVLRPKPGLPRLAGNFGEAGLEQT